MRHGLWMLNVEEPEESNDESRETNCFYIQRGRKILAGMTRSMSNLPDRERSNPKPTCCLRHLVSLLRHRRSPLPSNCCPLPPSWPLHTSVPFTPTTMASEGPDPQSLKSWEDAFQYPIPTVRRVEQELRRDIASNKEKLRALVG